MRTEVVALLVAIAMFLLYLFVERLLLDRRIGSIPLRIAVTGTRGKSSVVRLLASILRADGRTVLAKTTGSEPRYLMPDGNEVEVPRRGIASIIEQKKLIKKAADLGVDCVVAEVMSIHPENHRVESHRLLRPQIVVLTNVRLDHTDAMGATEGEIATVLSLGFTPAATVFMPERETRPALMAAVEEMRGELIEVAGEVSGSTDFPENLSLAWAVGRHLGISEDVIATGIRNTVADPGAVRVWEYRSELTAKRCYLVNGFAANDPQSTLQIVDRLRRTLPACPERLTGLLALRPDRGDRTWQWIDALQGGELACFDPVYATGEHAHAMKRKVPGLRLLPEDRPDRMMEAIMTDIDDGGVVFGCGNYVGTGRELVDHWERTATRHGL